MNIQQEKASPKDFFLNLMGAIALYVSASSLIALLFQYINIAFPDLLNPYYFTSATDTIRYSMASLIIVFPLYIFISWILNKEFAVAPEKRELKIRKWLIYFTLFIASAAIIIDLVTLVYTFLGGELTVRFILKVLSVLLVASGIFSYYLKDLKNPFSGKVSKKIAVFAGLVIFAIIVAGFFTAGSPLKARLFKLDNNKISDLQNIQSQIVNFWIQKEILPVELGQLKDSISGFVPPVDQETGESYKYKVIDPLSFELCANFHLASPPGQYSVILTQPTEMYYKDSLYGDNWNHDAGHQCFTRKIDPVLYQKTSSIIPTR